MFVLEPAGAQAPRVTSNPASETVLAGQSASFNAAATGTPAPTVQWQISTNGGSSFADVAGATATTYIFTAAAGQSGNEYRAVFTNSAGSATTSAATLTIDSPTGQMHGVVFLDPNLNGAQDAGEPGLSSRQVFLDLNHNGVPDPGEPSTRTNANGAYTFSGLTPGTYTVRQALLGGALLSAPSGGSYQATVTAGTSVNGGSFADVYTSITVPLTLPPGTAFPAQGNANADYVEAVYRAVLNRDADPAGLSWWNGLLKDGADTRLQVVQGIRNSPEHFGQEIDAFYLTLLGRLCRRPGPR